MEKGLDHVLRSITWAILAMVVLSGFLYLATASRVVVPEEAHPVNQHGDHHYPVCENCGEP